MNTWQNNEFTLDPGCSWFAYISPISGQGSHFMPSENTSVFRGYKMKALARNGLMTVLINYQGYYITVKAYLYKSHFTSNICGLYLFKVNNKDNSKKTRLMKAFADIIHSTIFCLLGKHIFVSEIHASITVYSKA